MREFCLGEIFFCDGLSLFLSHFPTGSFPAGVIKKATLIYSYLAYL